ncbi:MAG: NAD(P)-binding domain-containing protein [Acidobacteriota bacterium]
MKHQETNQTGEVPAYDYVIIGAGPAGLQLGYYMEKAGWNYLILEAGDSPGTFFKTFPRHRKLISINKVYTGYEDREINFRWDWNSLLCDDDEMLFKNFSRQYFPSADDMVEYLGEFARHFNLNVEYEARVAKISKQDGYQVTDAQGREYRCRHLIVATGLFNLYDTQIPGAELCEKYTDMSVNPEDFTNQRVLIVGKGNSGFETADNLIETASLIHIVSPTPLKMAWKTKYVGHLRAVNNNFLDTYQLKSQNVVLDAKVDKIRRENGQYVVTFTYGHADGEQEDLIYDRVLICTGWRFDDSIFDESCRPQLAINGKFPSLTSEWESSNVPDLYFAGGLMQMRDFKKKQSGFIHGFRYNIGTLFNLLGRKHHNLKWPGREIARTPEAIKQAIIERVNVSSALWQQTGFIGDIVLFSRDGETAQYYEDVALDYAHDSEFGRSERYYTVTLEFGQDIINASPDVFAVERIHKDDTNRAELSSGIHPIIRGYERGRKISEFHIIEDIASEWKEQVHCEPLLEFLRGELQGFSQPARAVTPKRVSESVVSLGAPQYFYGQ